MADGMALNIVRGINKQITMNIDFKLLNCITVQFVFTANSE